MNTKSFRSLILAAFVLGTAAAATSAETAAAASAETAKPKVVGVLFYADWCASCKVLEPKLNAVKKDFAGKSVLFTRVDFTDDFTIEQSDLLASFMDLGSAYTAEGHKTGFMLLFDSESKKILGRLVKDQTEDELRTAIKETLRG